MLAVTLTLTPMYAVYGCLGLMVFSAAMGCYRSHRHLSFSDAFSAVALISGFLVFVCVGWHLDYADQEDINNMSQWTKLYRAVEDKHPVVQEANISAFLAKNANLEQMTGENFTRLMEITHGLGADDLIGFVKAPDAEKTTVEDVNISKDGN